MVDNAQIFDEEKYPEYSILFRKWVDQGVGIRKALIQPDYICAANLMTLMQWRIDMDERWEKVNKTMCLVSLYDDLRESLDHIISSLELVVLLQKLEPRTI